MRSIAIAERIQSKGGICRFSQSNFDFTVSQQIKSHGFIYSSLEHDPGIPWNISENPTWLIDVAKDVPNIVNFLRTQWPNAKIASLDSHQNGDHYPDAIVNLRPDLDNSFLRPQFVSYHSGFQFAIIRDEFRNYRNFVKTTTNPTNVLVCFGSSDVGCNTDKVLSSVISNPIDDIVIHVIIGPNAVLRTASIKLISTSPIPVQIYDQPLNVPKVMSLCDIAICGGGTTMLELAYLGVPSIIIGQTKDEEDLALLLAEHGVGISLGNATTFNDLDVPSSCHFKRTRARIFGHSN